MEHTASLVKNVDYVDRVLVSCQALSENLSFSPFQAVNSECFNAFLSIPAPQFKLVMDAIIWAFKHTMLVFGGIGVTESLRRV
jgi:hypothetical protein